MTTASSSLCTTALAVAVACVLGTSPARSSEADEPGVDAFYRINDTGLSRCTRDFATLTRDCAGTGQDIESGRDNTHPAKRDGHAGFSFTKVCNSGELAGTGTCLSNAVLGPAPDDWGCLHDRVTGLEWELKTNDGSERGQHRRFTYVGDGSSSDASGYVDAINASGMCGHADWRLPTTYELFGLVNFNRPYPDAAVDPHWIPHTPAEWWWAVEPYFGQEERWAWSVNFVIDPSDVVVFHHERSKDALVRLVRGSAASRPRTLRLAPVIAGDEVVDRAAHVVWRRCVEGMAWNGTTCEGQAAGYSFTDAIARAQSEAARTGDPWRLPNIKELHMIVDENTFGPVIDLGVFPGTPANLHWSSTVSSYDPSVFWVVDFLGGRLAAYTFSYSLYLRLVRDE